MTDSVQPDRPDESAGTGDPGVPSVAQDDFDDGLGGDSRGGVSRGEDPGDPDEQPATVEDEGDVTGARGSDEQGAAAGAKPDQVVRVADN